MSEQNLIIEDSVKIKDHIIMSINQGEDLHKLLMQVDNILGRNLSYNDRMEAHGLRELLRYKIGFEECINILNPEQIHIIKNNLTKLNLI